MRSRVNSTERLSVGNFDHLGSGPRVTSFVKVSDSLLNTVAKDENPSTSTMIGVFLRLAIPTVISCFFLQLT